MNGYDANALEAALRLKDQLGGKVTVVSLGPDSARDTLKRAIAMGADAAIHINDPALNDADSTTTALALGAAIKTLDHVDLILSGRQASDTDGGQVHLGVARHLGLPAVSPIQKIEEASAESIIAERIVEDGYQRLKIKLPALLGVSSEMNEPRYPPLKGIMAAGRAQIPVLTAADLGLADSSPKVQLRRLYVETREAKVELIQADSLVEAGQAAGRQAARSEVGVTVPGVLLIAVALGEQLSPTTAELAGEAVRLSAELGGPVTALLAGKNIQGLAASLGGLGVDQVLVADSQAPQPPSPEWLLAAAEQAARQTNPAVILLTHGGGGRDLGPSLAYRLETGIVTDATALRIEDGQLVITKPVFGGSAIAEFSVVSTPSVVTLRPRAFEAPESPTARDAQVEAIAPADADSAIEVLEEIREQATTGPRLKDAKVIVSGGRGLGGPENWHYIDELAQVLGAATRRDTSRYRRGLGGAVAPGRSDGSHRRA